MSDENKDTTPAENEAEEGVSKKTLYCSFCGKSQHEVRKLIAGPTVFICDECVELCMDIIREETKGTLANSDEAQRADGLKRLQGILPGHQSLIEFLFSVAADLSRPNRTINDRGYKILLAGVRGSGLTGAIADIWQAFDLPLVRYDAARLRDAKILDGADMFLRLLQQCEYNLDRASRGAIVIENIDRLFEATSSSRIAQEELELLLSGTMERVPPAGGRKIRDQENLQLDTTGISFFAMTSKLHVNDAPILSNNETPTLRFENNHAQIAAALIQQGAQPGLIERFDNIREHGSYTYQQIEQWLASPHATPHLDVFEQEGVLNEELRSALVKQACARGAGLEGLISILRLIKLRRSFKGPDGAAPDPIDAAWLEKSI